MSVPADLLDEAGRKAALRLLRRGVRLGRAADRDRGPQEAGLRRARDRAVRVPHRGRRADDRAAPRSLRPVGRHRGRARRRARQGEGLRGARRPGGRHRQGDRRPRRAGDHVDLRRLPAADDGGDPVLGVPDERAALGRVRPAGMEARVHRLGRGRGRGPGRSSSRSSPSASATTTSGSTTTSRRCRGARPRTASRRSRCSPRCRRSRRRPSSASSSRARATATPACSPRKPRASTSSPAVG